MRMKMEELNGYTPPASLNLSDFQDAIGDAVVQAIIKIGIRVNREELLKALKYDRGQYQKGYDAGFSAGFCETLQTVRCMECRYYDPDCGGRCKHPSGLPSPNWNDFCSHSVKGEDPT